MLLEVGVALVLVAAAVWVLGAPPTPGPTQRAHPGELWTIFLMRLLRLIGYPKPLTSVEEVFEEVEKQTKGIAWKYEDEKKYFEKPVELIVQLSQLPNVHPFGKYLIRSLVIRRLVERLNVYKAHRDHPEISAIPIRRPIFILGFPRSGSSFLYSLLTKDPAIRSFTLWEQLDSTYCTPGDEEHAKALQAGARKTQNLMQLFFREVANELAHKHTIDIDRPEECTFVMAKSLVVGQMFDYKPLRDWFSDSDATYIYEFHKANVQLIQHNRPNPETVRWVFKAPMHSHHLAEIKKVYPDAIFVLTQREPTKIVSSVASLRSSLQQIVYDPYDMTGTNREYALTFISKSFRKLKAVMDADPDKHRYFRSDFNDLLKDPVSMVKKIYAHHGIEYTDRYDKILRDFVKEDQAQHKSNVRHEHSLKDFNITEEDVKEHYADYIKFNDSKE